ncbi:hypothetical protein D7I39_21860 [Allopusillimonas ginsengisoli]|nr:hypothetical protein D7I39_21860 [Allopusillimonas ginsengisoli]
MTKTRSLLQLVAEADELQAKTRLARAAALTHIREQSPELDAALNDLFADNDLAQAQWIFRQLFRREERPIDLILTGRTEEVTHIALAIAYGIYL